MKNLNKFKSSKMQRCSVVLRCMSCMDNFTYTSMKTFTASYLLMMKLSFLLPISVPSTSILFGTCDSVI